MLTQIQGDIEKKDSVSHVICRLLNVWNKSALELLYILIDAKSWTYTIIWTIQAAGFVAIAILWQSYNNVPRLTKLQLTRYVEDCISVRWYLSCLYVESFIAHVRCHIIFLFHASKIKFVSHPAWMAKSIN